MSGTDFLSNFVSSTASVITGAGVPILIIGLAFLLTVFSVGLIIRGMRGGIRKVIK